MVLTCTVKYGVKHFIYETGCESNLTCNNNIEVSLSREIHVR